MTCEAVSIKTHILDDLRVSSLLVWACFVMLCSPNAWTCSGGGQEPFIYVVENDTVVNVTGDTLYVAYDPAKSTVEDYRGELGIEATGALDTDVYHFFQDFWRTADPDPEDDTTTLSEWTTDDDPVTGPDTYMCTYEWDDVADTGGIAGSREDGTCEASATLNILLPTCEWVSHSETTETTTTQGLIGWNLRNWHHFSYKLNGAPYGLGLTGGEVIDMNLTRYLLDANGKQLYFTFQQFYNDHVSSMAIFETSSQDCPGHAGLNVIDDTYGVSAFEPAIWIDGLAQQAQGVYPLKWSTAGSYYQDIWLHNQSLILWSDDTVGIVQYHISKDGQGNLAAYDLVAGFLPTR